MQTPDITKAQYVAIVQPVITVAVAFGAPVSDAQSTALIGLAGAFSTALVVADAIIRRGRSNNAAAIATAKVVLDQIEPTPAPAYVPEG